MVPGTGKNDLKYKKWQIKTTIFKIRMMNFMIDIMPLSLPLIIFYTPYNSVTSLKSVWEVHILLTGLLGGKNRTHGQCELYRNYAYILSYAYGWRHTIQMYIVHVSLYTNMTSVLIW